MVGVPVSIHGIHDHQLTSVILRNVFDLWHIVVTGRNFILIECCFTVNLKLQLLNITKVD